jgi:tripeptidyl-peptidase-1
MRAGIVHFSRDVFFVKCAYIQNDARIAAGKSPLGFLNPFIYAYPGIFNDVTSGNNPGCSTTGFEAAAGWDPVTG